VRCSLFEVARIFRINDVSGVGCRLTRVCSCIVQAYVHLHAYMCMYACNVCIYLIYGLFNDALNRSEYAESSNMMINEENEKRYKRRRSWPNLRYCSGIFLEGLRKTAKNLNVRLHIYTYVCIKSGTF
jgi:hypothetical protein